MCLKPSGRGEHECVVHVPNEFTRRLTPPGFEDFKELEQISEGAITPKCARPHMPTLGFYAAQRPKQQPGQHSGLQPAVLASNNHSLYACGLGGGAPVYMLHPSKRMYFNPGSFVLQHAAGQQHRDDEGPERHAGEPSRCAVTCALYLREAACMACGTCKQTLALSPAHGVHAGVAWVCPAVEHVVTVRKLAHTSCCQRIMLSDLFVGLHCTVHWLHNFRHTIQLPYNGTQ